jgi:pyridoxamine 5'-phosphate oxidase
MQKIANIRKEYMLQSLLEKDIDQHPINQFEKWWQQAIESKIEEVNAMTLATVNKEGHPAARIVLLKGYDENGFVFFSNYNSDKAKSIESNPNVCLVFFWKELERQIRINGTVEKITEAESDMYFNSRPLVSKIGAWASPQSQELASRIVLENSFNEYQEKFSSKEIARPPYWGGYNVIPNKVEFWQGRPGRLHDRILYTQKEKNWVINRLAP